MNIGGILLKYVRHLMSIDPLLGKIGSKAETHMGRISYLRDSKVMTTDMVKMSSELAFTYDEIRDYDIQAVASKIFLFADSIVGQFKVGMFSKLSEIMDFTGRTIDGKGKPASPEIMLDALETMEIRFDKEGNPELPMFVVPPKAKAALSLTGTTSTQDQRYKEIIERKRKEYLDKKRYRKLSRIGF